MKKNFSAIACADDEPSVKVAEAPIVPAFATTALFRAAKWLLWPRRVSRLRV